MASRLAFLLIIFLFISSPAIGSWIDSKDAGHRGWYGYEPLKTKEEKETAKKQKQQRPQKISSIKWPSPQQLYEMYPDDIQKWIDEAEKEAIHRPTEENIKRWIVYLQVADKKATEFAGMWAWVMQTNPNLYKQAAYAPVMQPGRIALAKSVREEINKTFSNYRNRYALLFFLGNNQLSLAQLQIINLFRERYPEWRIEIVDVDKNPLLAKRLGITYTPQIWLLSRKGKAVPVIAGTAALSTLEQKIYNTILVLEGKKPKTYSPFTRYSVWEAKP